MQLHCVIRGVDSDTKLILLHGLFGNHRNLLPIARAFEDRYQVYLPDMRNHGSSFHADDIDYEIMSEDLHDVINHFEIKNPIIIGHSMGGKVAMAHALNHPQYVHKLVVMDIAPVAYQHDYQMVIDNLLSIDLSSLSSRNDADQYLQQFYKNKNFRDFLLQNLKREQENFHWRANLTALKNNLSAICQFPTLSNRQYSKPTVFLAGQDSKYVDEKYRPQIKQYFPNYQLDYIAGAGHWLHAEQPQVVIEKIRAFITD